MTKKKLPKELLELSNCYLGDSSWEKFVNSLNVDEKVVDEISKTFNVHKTVAKAIEWHIGKNYAEQWFNREIPVLYDYKPIDLVKNYEDGEICLREILMRMH